MNQTQGEKIKIVGVAGSMQSGSRVRVTVERILHEAERFGAQTQLLDLRTLDLPMFRPGESEETAPAQAARDTVAWADAFILGSPDYHGSMSGALKNFLDYHWMEFTGKLFGFACASHEKGLTVMGQMRTAVSQCYGWSLPYNVGFNAEEVYTPGGEITDPSFERRLRMTARDLTIYGELLRDQWALDLNSTTADTFAARYREQ